MNAAIPGAMISRRTLLRAAGLAGAAAMIPLTGCGATPGQQNGVTTLRFMQNKPEVIDYFDRVIKDFEALNPDIRVIQDFNEGNFVPGLVRNDPPDVVTRGFAQATADFVKKGIFADLTDLPAAATINPEMQDLISSWGQYNGNETNALPFSVAAAGVLYNRDIFDLHDVAVPATWDEFLAACETFKAAGIAPIYGTYKDTWTLAQGMFDYAIGGTLDVAGFFTKIMAKGADISATAPESFTNNFGPALPKMLQLAAYSQDGAASRNYADGNAAFAKGEAAMYLQGPWALSQLVAANPAIRVGTFPLPVTNNPEETKARVNVDMALSITRNTPNKAAAERFVGYLLQPAVVNTYNEKNAAFSPLKDAPAVTNPQISGLSDSVKEARYYQGAVTYFPPSVPVNNYIQSFVYSKNGDQFLSALDDEWRRVAERTAV
ncbi:raffinose/stachyose/melibiose transport system substrate-binding protein [Arthrobacter sp. V4I6]|uniref:ABC transporter substrate-binding protein n=1 Tax=Arthrobacter sp. V4I6 TaxID=3042281 RepID=UPI00277FC2FE|nr:extracellular solute-binding protein [Arthrobacter sp. V4I6]MDQ0851907.1 raffinose/stachyose/melibiose transport system substrate-binding protein [Arthrobacter sp. V4I6]